MFEDQHDARRVSDALGIPHFAFDRRELFQKTVVQPFVDAYLEGRTPSPCVDCNRTVKMHELFELADRLGARSIATGHYAKIVEQGGASELHRGRDAGKDQSYFLHVLTPEQRARVVLPLGDATKEEVRAEALSANLPGATKGESQELCFVGGDYESFVRARADGRLRPGPILDERGRQVGAHEGVHRFTVGQRKGIGVAVGQPRFVVGIDAATSSVQLGDEEALRSTGALLDEGRFDPDIELPIEVDVKVRARHEAQPAMLTRDGAGRRIVKFRAPVRAVAPGQIAVAYLGTRVVGGATILESMNAPRSLEQSRGAST